MSNRIEVIKIGLTLNLWVNGKLRNVIYQTENEAKEAFLGILKIRENPTDENMRNLYPIIKEKTRILAVSGFEHDVLDGKFYLEGFNTPVPDKLFEIIKEYSDNHYPLNPIVNFWKLLMANPDERVRTSLFDFISTHDFSLTDKGYMITYKAVCNQILDDSSDDENEEDEDYDDEELEEENEVIEEEVTTEVNVFTDALKTFIEESIVKVKKWKTSLKKYVVYYDIATSSYKLTKRSVFENWVTATKTFVGSLDELALVDGETFTVVATLTETVGIENLSNEPTEQVVDVEEEINELEEIGGVYTDKHSKTMRIVVGTPVKQERIHCDSDPSIDCSRGLHVGATKYVEKFAGIGDTILVCLVNPMNVIAVPKYDHSKMRVCEYFPFALANFKDSKIEIIDQAYFENDYANHEEDELNALLISIKDNQIPLATCINGVDDKRPMSELVKIIENRLIDLND